MAGPIRENDLARAMALARNIALSQSCRLVNRDPDELTSVSYAAVAEAIATYDPKLGPFINRVGYLVVRRLKDYFRSLDTMSRGMRQAASRRYRERGDETLMFDWVDPDRIETYSLSPMLNREGKEEPWDIPSSMAKDPTDQLYVEELLSKLKPRHRLALELYFIHDFTMKEVAAVLGVGESRVSQMINYSVLELSGYVGKLDVANRYRTQVPHIPCPGKKSVLK